MNGQVQFPTCKSTRLQGYDYSNRGGFSSRYVRKGYDKIFDFIQNNPARWKEDCFYTVE